MATRRDFLKLLCTVTAAGVLVPELVKPERRFWQVGANLGEPPPYPLDEMRGLFGIEASRGGLWSGVNYHPGVLTWEQLQDGMANAAKMAHESTTIERTIAEFWADRSLRG